MRTTTLALLAISLLTFNALAAGCGEDGETPASDGGYSVSGSIRELPASIATDAPLILTGDLVRASEVAGSERPADVGSDEADAWVADLAGVSDQGERPRAFVPFPEALDPLRASPEDMDAQVGWSVVDVESFVALTQPPEDFLVVCGDLDEDSLSEDLSEVEDGIVTDVAGEDHEHHLDAPTAFSRLGVPTRLAVDDGRIAASPDTDAVGDWLEEEGSLADDDAYADVAGALDRNEVYAAVLARAGTTYDVVGIGWAADGDGPLVTTAYHFASEEAARDSVDALRELYESGTSVQSQRPFSDYLEVQSAEVDESVVVVTSRPTGDGGLDFAYRALISRDLLFVGP